MKKESQDAFLVVRISQWSKTFMLKLAKKKNMSLSQWVRSYMIERTLDNYTESGDEK